MQTQPTSLQFFPMYHVNPIMPSVQKMVKHTLKITVDSGAIGGYNDQVCNSICLCL